MNNTQKLDNKILAIIGEIGALDKAGNNSTQNYDYFSEAQLMGILKTLFVKHRITFSTSVEDLVCQEVTRYNKPHCLASVKTKHTFYDVDSDEFFTVFSYGQGVDGGDKAVYKAITGATKYALMKNFMISDYNDPEKPNEIDKEDRKPAQIESYVVQFIKYLDDNKIGHEFILKRLSEQKQITDKVKAIGAIPTHIINSLYNKREDVKIAWNEYNK